MRYLKRLKNELQDLTDKLTPKGPNPEYMSVKKLNRQLILKTVITLIQKARALDHATDYWTQGSAEAWIDFRANVENWLNQAPKMPEKLIEKDKVSTPEVTSVT